MTLSTESVESRKTIRCLVIQLGRLGDTLQSLMALRASKQLYPQLEITFLVRDSFSSAAKRIPWLERVLVLPAEDLTRPLLRGEKTEAEALSELARWMSPIITNKTDPWDLIVNWTYSETSSYLTGLIPAKIKLGYTRKKDSSFFGADGWSHYIQAIVQGGISQNVHLTDVLTTQLLTALQIHAGDPATDGNTPLTSKSFFSLRLHHRDFRNLISSFRNSQTGSTSQEASAPENASRKWLAIQLGTGSPLRSWDPSNWGKLAKLILERHSDCGVILLGGADELEKAESFLKEIPADIISSGRMISLVGKTDFDLWASVIGHAQWLFAGETAAIHLASVLGTRVVTLALDSSKFLEVGAYGNGHYIVSSLPEERSKITPETIYAVWSYGSNEWSHRRQLSLDDYYGQIGFANCLNSARVFRSRIRSTNDGGGVVYEAMSRQTLQLSDWTALVMGHIARFWYCGWVPPVGHELVRHSIGPVLIKKLRELQECGEVLLKICEKASKTATSLQIRASTLKSEKVMGLNDRAAIHKLGEELQDLGLLVEDLGKNHFPLTAFAQMSKVLLHHLKGGGLSEMGKETALAYRQLGDGVRIFKDWAKFTLELAKPVAVAPVVIQSQGIPGPRENQEVLT